MTAILGIHLNGVSYLAADSRSSGGGSVTPTTARKIVQSGPWAIAVSGPTRLGNLLHAAAGPRDRLAHCTDIHEVVKCIKILALDDGFKPNADAGAACFECFGLIIAHRDGVWHVGSDFGYCQIDENRPWAQGSGGDLALGAFNALLNAGFDVVRCMTTAIDIAGQYDQGTDRRAVVVVVGEPEEGAEIVELATPTNGTGQRAPDGWHPPISPSAQ